QRARVVGVADGDMLLVRLAKGKTARMRIAGIAAPGGRDCYATAARARVRAASLGKIVRLAAAGSGRWYATLPSGVDLGRGLLADGFAQIDVWGPAFTRFPDDVESEQLAQAAGKGLWGA